MKLMIHKGGEGSGNFDHDGRPGLVGGSAPTHPLFEPYPELDIDVENEILRAGGDILNRWGNKSWAEGWGHNDWYNQMRAGWTYKGTGYKTLNARLRKGEMPRDAKYLDDLMHNGYFYERDYKTGKHLSLTEAPQNMVVYRALGNSKAVRNFEFKPGMVFEDKAFSSTSLRRSGAETVTDIKVMMKINVPKGTKGLFMDMFSRELGEHEFLLPRSSKFRVMNVSTNSEGVIELGMELLND